MGYFSYEALLIISAVKIIKRRKLLNYVLKNPKCAKMYHLLDTEKDILNKMLDTIGEY